MRLTRSTDYGLRVLLYAAAFPDRRVSTEEISTAFGISLHNLGKIVNQLGQAGWLDLKRGRGGGLRLAQPPEAIGVGAVVRRLEPDLHLVECFDRARNTCPIVPVCGLIGPFGEARRAFLAALDRYTLADVVPLHDPSGVEQLVTLLGGGPAEA